MQPTRTFSTSFGTDATLLTTTETLIVTSPLVRSHLNSALITVSAYAQLTTGVATTGVVVRIRKGASLAGALIGESNTITIGAAAGSTEVFSMLLTDQLEGEQITQYSLTLQQVAATGNGTVLRSGIVVLLS